MPRSNQIKVPKSIVYKSNYYEAIPIEHVTKETRDELIRYISIICRNSAITEKETQSTTNPTTEVKEH